MARYIIPGFRKIETSGGGEGGEGGTTNYNDLTNKPFINDVPLVGNLHTVNLKLTDATLTEEGVPAEAKTVGQKLEEQSTSLTALSNQLGNHTVKSDVPENAVFTDTVYNDKDIKAEIAKKADATAVPSKVSELTNDRNYQTAEQVSSTVTTEIAKVVADAPEDFDTLKEMSDWIAGHEDDASAMNSAISDNKTAIASLQTGKADKSEIPKTLPANGGNADTVNNHTVETDVPVDAKFTDTVYDDTEVKGSIIELNSNLNPESSNLAINTSYVATHSIYNTICRKIGNMIFISGVVVTTQDIAAGTTLFTLPSGFKPAEYSIINGLKCFNGAAKTNAEILQFNIDKNGSIAYFGTGIPKDSTITISGIVFG